MNIKNKTLSKIVGLMILVGLIGTSCQDLSVENTNEPDASRAQASATDMRAVANGLFQQWYNYSHWYGMKMALSTGADASTAAWGNAAMQDMGTEPRIAWSNAKNYSYAFVTSDFFNNLYAVNSSATDVMNALDDGAMFGGDGSDNAMISAQAKLAQALTLGYIGLVFDQGYIVDENSTPEELANPTLVPYTDLIDHAVTKLEEVVEICNQNTFTIDDGFMALGVPIDDQILGKIANTYIAKFLSDAPRNKAQNDAVDWGKVLTHANNGIDFDLTMQADGRAPWQSSSWYDESLVYLIYPGWGRVDMRVVNMMEPDEYPASFNVNDNTDDYPVLQDTANLDDQRLITDMQYLGSNAFPPERGYYHWSNYRHSRYGQYVSTFDIALPAFLQAENDMIRAEAELYENGAGAAASIINSGTRVTRGGMTPVNASASEVRQAIHHERMVELFNSGIGVQFFEMRNQDLLQEGTLLHFPLPASVLETLGRAKPFYTFGGVENADGENTSNGGWK